MKYLHFVVVMSLFGLSLSATTLLNENFSGNFLPEGWSIDLHSDNWQQSDTQFAGGESPEACLKFFPTFGGTTRLISPPMDTGTSNVACIDFRHMLDYWENSMVIGVATRSGEGDWHTVWEETVTDTVAAERRNVEVANTDLGSQFQVCFYFTSETSANLNYWYIDDVLVYTPSEIDVAVYDIPTESHYDVNTPMTPSAVIANEGQTDQTFNVLCAIDQWQIPVYSSTKSLTLAAGATQTVNFDEFTPTTPGEFYYLHVTTQLTGDQNESNDTLTARFEDYDTEKSNVLVEIFTGTWCSFCPGAALAADDMIENGLDAAIIEYHYNDSYSNAAGTQRLNMYGVYGLPTAVFDGLSQYAGGDEAQSIYETYVPYYQARVNLKTMFSIGFSGSHDGNDYQIRANVNKTGRIDDGLNLALFLAVTESEISESWQGLDHLDFVERSFLPDTTGAVLDFSMGDLQSVYQDFTLDSSWNADNSEIVAFVQNTDTKEVYQAAKIALPDLTSVDDNIGSGAIKSCINGNYPNPFNPSTTISYSLQQSGKVALNVYDVRGRLVRTLVKETQAAGSHNVLWNGRDNDGKNVASGVYFINMVTKDAQATKKMVMMK